MKRSQKGGTCTHTFRYTQQIHTDTHMLAQTRAYVELKLHPRGHELGHCYGNL